MIQIPIVPDALHRRRESRVALAGVSLSEYLLRELGGVAERPTVEEPRARLHERSGRRRRSPAEAPLLTCDRRIAGAAGHQAWVELA